MGSSWAGLLKCLIQKLVSLFLSLSLKALSHILSYSLSLSSQMSNPFSLFSSYIYNLKIVDWVMISLWYHSCEWSPIWLFFTKICFVRNRSRDIWIGVGRRKLLGSGVSPGTPSLPRYNRVASVHLLIMEIVLSCTELPNDGLKLLGY